MPSPPPPDRAVQLRGLREALRAWSPPLEVLVEHILGLDARIDLVAQDGAGQAYVVRLADAGDDLPALTDLLAQRAWLLPRLEDWLQLAPKLGIDPRRGVRGLLVATRFEARTMAAADSLADDLVSLARLDCHRENEWTLEPCGPAREPVADPPTPQRLESTFRTGLEDVDEADAASPPSEPGGYRTGS